MIEDIEENKDKCSSDSNIRKSAMEWWKSELGNRYNIMIIHKDKILNAENRHPTQLTGREIEILYKAES